MNPILLDLGFIQIHWYSVTMLLALLIGGYLALREAKKFGISENFMINLYFFLVPIALLGARLYFVAFHWDYYSNNFVEIFKVWEGGLAIHGGIIAGLLWIIFYTKRYKVSTFRVLDTLVVGLIIGQAIGRWGNFFNGEAYGPETTSTFLKSIFIPDFIIEGMYIDGAYHHPTFLYESLWCIIGFIILLFVRRTRYIKIGQVTCSYLVWYSIGRFFIESMRTDSLMLMNFKVAQLVSLIMFIVGIILFVVLGRGSRFENQYNNTEDVHEVVF